MGTPTRRVFVSSTAELRAERQHAERALNRLRETKFVGMEYFGSRPEAPETVCLTEVDHSDIFVVIVGDRYGSGMTEKEYDRARARHLPCLVYFKDIPPEPSAAEQPPAQPALTRFKARLRAAHHFARFASAEDLYGHILVDVLLQLTNPAGHASVDQPIRALPPLPQTIVGREQEVEQVLRAIEGGTHLIILRGMPGVGKSTLATLLAAHAAAHYPEGQVLVTAASAGTDPVAAVLHKLVTILDPHRQAPSQLEALRAAYHAAVTSRRLAIILDNVSEPSIVAEVRAENVLVLAASELLAPIEGALILEVPCLAPHAAAELLSALAPRARRVASANAQHCGYLPLALRLAGEFLAAHPDYTAEEYEVRLRTTADTLDWVRGPLSLSYDRLEASVQQVFRAVSTFAGRFSVDALAALLDTTPAAAKRKFRPRSSPTL